MTIDEFEELFKLDPESNKTQTFSYVSRYISRKFKTFTGADIDYQFILNSYKDYCNWWMRKHGSKDPRYLSSKDKKANLIKFLSDSMYDSDWSISKNSRDGYLLGNISFSDFKAKVDAFKKMIDSRNSEHLEANRLSLINLSNDSPKEEKPTTEFEF